MGVAGWRFAPVKRNAGGRAVLSLSSKNGRGILLSGGRGQLDDHDRDHALQRFGRSESCRGRSALRGRI